MNKLTYDIAVEYGPALLPWNTYLHPPVPPHQLFQYTFMYASPMATLLIYP